MLEYQRLAKIRAIANSARLVKRKSFFSCWHAICLPSTFHASPSQCAKINLCRIAFFPCAPFPFPLYSSTDMKNSTYNVKVNASTYYSVRLALAANVLHLQKRLAETANAFGRHHDLTKNDFRELREARRARNSFCRAEISIL